MSHEIRVQVIRRTGGVLVYRATCSCGYRSRLYGYPGHAEKASGAHKQAKASHDQAPDSR